MYSGRLLGARKTFGKVKSTGKTPLLPITIVASALPVRFRLFAAGIASERLVQSHGDNVAEGTSVGSDRVTTYFT
jgi:hypothetical protein